MTAIRVNCRLCGREVNSTEVDKALHCTVCVGRQAIGRSLERYAELWAKRTRYRRAGAPHAALERQIGQLAVKMSVTLHKHIRSADEAARVLNEAIAEAQGRAVGAQRIVIGKTLLVKA